LSFRVQLYGMTKHRDLFTPRQLVALTTFSDLVAEAREQILADALAAALPDDIPLRDGGRGGRGYAEAVSVYLAFAVDRSADFWGSLAFWANQPKNEIVAHVFGRQALPMVWDFAEANPYSSSGGNWLGILEYIAKGLDGATRLPKLGVAKQADATQLDKHSRLMISTDPPYYDNIGYADLSDYFYVWLRASLRSVYPDIFATMLVPKTPEIIASPHRFNGDAKAANDHFETGLMQAFSQIRRIILPEFPLTVYYSRFAQIEPLIIKLAA
jgi:putative DNA methylase